MLDSIVFTPSYEDVAGAGFDTHAGLIARLIETLQETDPETVLALLENLYHLGIAWATKSGASFSPFVGEGLRLPPPPASDAAPSWEGYGSLVDEAIMSQGEFDPTLKAPARAVRSGARGSVAQLRATIGPWTVSSPYDAGGPIAHGFRDGLTAEELWAWTGRARAALHAVHQAQVELAVASRLSGDRTFLGRAMAAQDPAIIFAEAAEAGESDPLTDPEVRLWMGLAPRGS